MLDTYRHPTLPRFVPGILNRQTCKPLIRDDLPEQISFNREAFRNLPLSDQVLFEKFGQGPSVSIPYDCIHHPFEAYAATQPDAVAVEHLGESITYRELDRQANA